MRCDIHHIYTYINSNFSLNTKTQTDMDQTILPLLMNVPLLLLHGYNLPRSPRMATAGMVSTLATLGTCSLHLAAPWSVPPLVATVLDMVYTLSLLEFVHTFHEIMLNDKCTHVVKYAVGISAIAMVPVQTVFVETFLVIFAVYIATQLSSVFLLLNYIFLLVVFSLFDSLHIFMYVCFFALTSMSYEMVELDKAIRDAKRSA